MSRAVLLPFGDTGRVYEPVYVRGFVRPEMVHLEVQRARMLGSGIDVRRLLSLGPTTGFHLVASATLARQDALIKLKKGVLVGTDWWVCDERRKLLTMTESSVDDVIRQMVRGVLEAADSLGKGMSGLRWSSALFRRV
ncbi:MAG: hypothetical protein HYT76_00255 [Deltaproteobacteria bacterium]|nr:hypothetical protein [Deltaproteobacteria bacterium]